VNSLDPDRTRFLIPAALIEATAGLLAEPGMEGFEGSALWIGRVVDGTTAEVDRVYRPEQVAHATALGLAVTLTEEGLTELIRSLTGDEIVLARLHTHGNDDIDHSEIDNRNLVVAHPGAVSIVVPHFAADGIDLARCGVHVLSVAHRWRRLTTVQTDERFQVR
jgi:hypothetical protein